jgi:hypothetical protein
MGSNDRSGYVNEPDLLHLIEQIDQLTNTFLEKFNTHQFILFDFPPHQRIFLFIFSRAMKTFRSITLLCQKGFGQDAAPLLRTLLENLISTRYILKDKDKADTLTKRFVDYKWIILKKRLGNPKKNSRQPKPQDPLSNKNKDLILQKAKGFKEEFHVKSDRALLTWSGKTLKDMAKAVSKELEKEYDATFRLCSRFSHPSIIGDREYMFQEDQKLTFSPLPSAIGTETNLQLASLYYLDFLTLADKLFLNEFNNEIIPMREKLESFIAQSKKLNDLSPDKKNSKQTILKESIVYFKTKN